MVPKETSRCTVAQSNSRGSTAQGTAETSVTAWDDRGVTKCTDRVVPTSDGYSTLPRDALEGKGPQRWHQRWLDGRSEEVANAARGEYWRWLGGGGPPSTTTTKALCQPPPPPPPGQNWPELVG